METSFAGGLRVDDHHGRDLEAGQRRRIAGRPLGVAAIAVLQLIHVVSVTLSLQLPGPFDLDEVRLFGDADMNDLVAPLVGLIGLAIAAGLWWFRPWAWFATMIWVGASMGGALFAYFDGEPAYPVMAMSVAVAFYLNQWEVRKAFRTLPKHEAHA